ncbi:hypothetical protein B0H17DRAFT_1196880 [Mycena rosella]|uniref:RNA helicase n=1 Tax=Mycena rosella TaxID=1033263 RepID=A0AAD7DUR5_MYCRO|nr:hypothetical protein B0H17DRAFT_1196880 [Mycena rosella]
MPPRKKTKNAVSPTQTQPVVNTRKPLTKAQLVGLQDHMLAKFHCKHIAHPYQMEGIEAQLQMRDVLVHAGTGMGKTTIAAGPHAHPSSAGKIMLMISPLIALHDEQFWYLLLRMAARYCSLPKWVKGMHLRPLNHTPEGSYDSYFFCAPPSSDTTRPQYWRSANVSILVRGIQHPLNTYANLDFMVAGFNSKENIKKMFIYADNITTGVEIIDHLTSLLPPELRDVGCNIPDIDVVFQWKLPASMSLFVQRAGRAARAKGRTGLAILLVEPSAYGIELAEGVSGKITGAKPKREASDKEKESNAEKREKAKKKKAYAKSRGVLRGSAGGKHDTIFIVETPALDPEAQNEGLLVLVQTMECRRAVLTLIYNNKPAREAYCALL